MKNSQGFTLVELIFTLLITVILTSMAVPSFNNLRDSNRALTTINELLADIHLARNEAVTRGERVVICHSSDGETCSGTWDQGWIVYVDSDDSIIQVKNKKDSQLELEANTKIKDYLSYIGTGRARDKDNALQNGTFKVTSGNYQYHLIISNSGRPRVKKI